MNILFDMDGVLFDVSQSYHEAICRTVEIFTGVRPRAERLREMKRQGGYNSDWKLSAELIRQAGCIAGYEKVVEVFQSVFWGDNFSGTIIRERPLINADRLRALSQNHVLGIVTGRPRAEAEYSLRRWEFLAHFSVVITGDDYPPDRGKPHPDGLQMALGAMGGQSAAYIGDIPDDVRAAKAAGITAVVFLPPNSGWTAMDFQTVQPDAIISHWKQLEEVLC